MKKRFARVAALCVAVSLLAACSGSGEAPYAIYQKIREATAQADSLTMHIVYSVEVRMDEGSLHSTMEGDVQQTGHGDALGMAAQLHTSLPDSELTSATYYREGVLYQEVGERRFQTPAEPEQVLVQLSPTDFAFSESSVALAELVDLPDSGDREIIFTIHGEEQAIWTLSQAVLASMGLPQDERSAVSPTYSDITYRVVYGEGYAMKSSQLDFSMDLTYEEQTASFAFSVRTEDVELNALQEIAYPDDLADYSDSLTLLQEELNQLNEELAALHDPTYRPIQSEYAVINEFGEDCAAAQLLAQEGENLDYFFWLLNQTQVGMTGQVPPTGFADPSEITTEGLIRLFCLANESRIAEFADLEEGVFQIPDELPPLFLSSVLQSYNYDPSTLPEAFGHADNALRFPLELSQPAPNPCRIERVEVLDAQRLRITATGLDLDRETPINTQEIVLSAPGPSQLLFESYRIELE